MVTVNKHRHAVKVGDSITALEEWLAQFSLLGYAEAVPWLRQLCLKTSNPEHHEAFIKPGLFLGLKMADILADLQADPDTLAAAILYQRLQFSEISIQTLGRVDNFSLHPTSRGLSARSSDVEKFLDPADKPRDVGVVCEADGIDPALLKLIKGVQKTQALSLFRVNPEVKHKQKTDNIRKMILAMVEDARVVLIKLVERLCVLREMDHLSDSQREQIAIEIKEVYAPLAHRLNINALKWEMEDLAFRYFEPEIYHEISQGLKSTRLAREQFIEKIISQVQIACTQRGISPITVFGRAKHIYSIYRKMKQKHLNLSEVKDAFAIRILVKTAEDCYRVLSLVHTLWHPIFSEYDDYISKPKPNGYQSLHSVIRDDDNHSVEVQIRTTAMHELAELGGAAHWKYKEGRGTIHSEDERKIAWLREVLAWHREMAITGAGDQQGYDVLETRVYVLTPQGDVIDMPKDSTPLDFAYHVHTQLGHRCRGVKVNGALVSFDYRLQMGDRVEVLVGKADKPSRDWLNPHLRYITTRRARSKILHWFHMQDQALYQEQGRAILERELKPLGVIKSEDLKEAKEALRYSSLDDLYAAVGRGELKSAQVFHRFLPHTAVSSVRTREPIPTPSTTQRPVLLTGVGRLATTLAKCCQPLPGDPVIGYITARRGVSVHRKNCANVLKGLETKRERFLDTEWAPESYKRSRDGH